MSSQDRQYLRLGRLLQASNYLNSFGAFALTFGLPVVVYLVALSCNDVSGCPSPSILHPTTLTLTKLRAETDWPSNGILGLFSLKAMVTTLGYYLVLLLMLRLLPGVECQGAELKTGGRLWYKINGMNGSVMAICTE